MMLNVRLVFRIRDNLFIVYGIINNALNNKINVDLSLYDIAKCFDVQWDEETMNDLWDVGVTDDKFALVSEMNAKCNISIKTMDVSQCLLSR